jgi:hypothetical protein
MTTTSEVGYNAGQRTFGPAILLSKLARVLVRLDHVASVVVNANHSMVRAAARYRVANRGADSLREHLSKVHFLRDKMEDSSWKFFRNKLRTLTGAERRLFERRAD